MANPTHRHTRSRRNKRRAANWKAYAPNTSPCPDCGEPKLSHTVCTSCGTYNGRKVLEIVEKEA